MKTFADLEKHLESIPNAPKKYKLAVGSLIFTPDDKVVLLERGSKARDSQGLYEGVGGGVDEGETDLHVALLREIHEEIGDVQVQIDKMLMVKILPGENYPWWVVVDFLCRLTGGSPQNMEPQKCVAIHLLGLKDIELDKLSHYQQVAMKEYKKQYGTNLYYH